MVANFQVRRRDRNQRLILHAHKYIFGAVQIKSNYIFCAANMTCIARAKSELMWRK